MLKAGILGCGNIGSLLDELQHDPSFPKTHAQSIKSLENYELVSLCDNNPDRVESAKNFWMVSQATTSISEFFKNKLDIVGIATPSKTGRGDFIEAAIQAGIRGILCEKPIAKNLDDALAIKRLIEKSDTKLIVNFIRRFDPALQEVKKMLDSETLGKPLKVICHYGKGIHNNGSHIIDLLNWFFGSPQSVLCTGTVDESMIEEENLNAFLNYGLFQVNLLAQNSKYFTCFEVDIFLTKGRIKILESGRTIEFYRVDSDPDFANYKIMILEKTLNNGLRQTLPRAYKELAELVTMKHFKNISGIEDSIEIIKTINAIEKSLNLKTEISL